MRHLLILAPLSLALASLALMQRTSHTVKITALAMTEEATTPIVQAVTVGLTTSAGYEFAQSVDQTISNEIISSTSVDQTISNEIISSTSVDQTISNEIISSTSVDQTISNEIISSTSVDQTISNEIISSENRDNRLKFPHAGRLPSPHLVASSESPMRLAHPAALAL